MPPKTEEEIREDERRKAREEAERNGQSGPLDFLSNLFGGGGGFNIFSLFLPIAIGFATYFGLKTDWGTNFLEGLVNIVPESWGWRLPAKGMLNMIGIEVDLSKDFVNMDNDQIRKTLAKQKVPENITEILAKDNVTFGQYLGDIREGYVAEKAAAGKTVKAGKVTVNGFTSAGTIFAMIKNHPQMAQALAKAGLSGTGAGPLDDTSKKLSGSLRDLVNSSMFDELLAPANRAKTLSVLQAVAPGTSVDTLNTMLATGLDAEGKPLPALRKMLTDLMTPKEDGTLPNLAESGAVQEYVATNPAAKQAVLEQLAKENPDFAAFYHNNGGKPFATFEKALGDDFGKLTAFGAGFRNTDDRITMMMTTAFNNRAALQAYWKDADVAALAKDAPKLAGMLQEFINVPEAAVAPIQKILAKNLDPINLNTYLAERFTTADANGKPQFDAQKAMHALLDVEVRDVMRTAGTDNLAALSAAMGGDKHVTEQNLNALIQFGEEISSNPANQNPAVQARNMKIVNILASVTGGAPLNAAVKGLTGAELAAFFQDPNNYNAVFHLVRGIDRSTLKPKEAKVLDYILNHLGKFGKEGNQRGFEGVFANAQAAQFLLDQINAPADNRPDWLKDMFAKGYIQDHGGEVAGKNSDIILGLGKILNEKTTDQNTNYVPPPASRTAGPLGAAI